MKLWIVEETVRFRAQRNVKGDEIRFSEQRIHIAEFSVEGFFNIFWHTFGIGIDYFHLKAAGATSNGAPDTAEADDAQRLAPDVCSAKLIEAPSLPVAGAGKLVAFYQAARNGHQKSPGKVGGSFI